MQGAANQTNGVDGAGGYRLTGKGLPALSGSRSAMAARTPDLVGRAGRRPERIQAGERRTWGKGIGLQQG